MSPRSNRSNRRSKKVPPTTRRKLPKLPPDVTVDKEHKRIRFKMPDGGFYDLPFLPTNDVIDAMFDVAGIVKPGETEKDILLRYQEVYLTIENLRNQYNSPHLRQAMYERIHEKENAFTFYRFGNNKTSLLDLSPKLRADVEANNARAQGMQKVFDLARKTGEKPGANAPYWRAFFKGLAVYGITNEAFDWAGFAENYRRFAA